MNIYLVGGAVRDALLGLTIIEKDYVVTGATPQTMIEKGFQPVGKDFPVFLHPKTKEEYALARTERKQGQGYHGFICSFDPNVSLEDDLLRRDLTINAIAQSKDGTLIDPYGGQHDLKHRCLRHVSPAFIEDPLRILRVARFSAKLPEFNIAVETQKLMKTMIASGELDHLPKERYWKEIHRAMAMPAPIRFFEVLSSIHATTLLFPKHFNPQLSQSICHAIPEATGRLAIGYWACSPKTAQNYLDQIGAPNHIKEWVNVLITMRQTYEKSPHFDADTWLSLSQKVDMWRRPERFLTALDLIACQPNLLPHWPLPMLQEQTMKLSQQSWGKDLPPNLQGKEIQIHIQQKKRDALAKLLNQS